MSRHLLAIGLIVLLAVVNVGSDLAQSAPKTLSDAQRNALALCDLDYINCCEGCGLGRLGNKSMKALPLAGKICISKCDQSYRICKKRAMQAK